jgi:hypothetical protein
MGKPNDLVQGTLDLLILTTLSLDSIQGWAIAKRIQQVSGEILQVQQPRCIPRCIVWSSKPGFAQSGRRARPAVWRSSIR